MVGCSSARAVRIVHRQVKQTLHRPSALLATSFRIPARNSHSGHARFHGDHPRQSMAYFIPGAVPSPRAMALASRPANLLKADLFVLVNSIATGATVSTGGPQVSTFGTVAESQTSINPGSTPITPSPHRKLDAIAGNQLQRQWSDIKQFIGPVTVPLSSGAKPAPRRRSSIRRCRAGSSAPVAALFLAFVPSAESVDDPQSIRIADHQRFNAGDTTATIRLRSPSNFKQERREVDVPDSSARDGYCGRSASIRQSPTSQ